MSQARLEATIATAHRTVWAAASQAERRGQQSCADDLHQIADELRRVGESLMSRRAYSRVLADSAMITPTLPILRRRPGSTE